MKRNGFTVYKCTKKDCKSYYTGCEAATRKSSLKNICEYATLKDWVKKEESK